MNQPEFIILESGSTIAMANAWGMAFIPLPFRPDNRNEFRSMQAGRKMTIVPGLPPATILQHEGLPDCSEQNKIDASSHTTHVA